MIVSDYELIKKINQGDKESLSILLERYQAMVYNYIRKNSKTNEDAEDLYQDIYIKIIRNLKNFKFNSQYKTWMFSIIRNKMIDNYRKKKLKLHSIDKSFKNNEGNLHDLISSEEDTPASSAVKLSEKEKLTIALNNLDPKLKEISVLKIYSSLKFKEIAEVLHMNENSVKTSFRRALKILKNDLKGVIDGL